MGFNYAREKAKFDRKWAVLRADYEQAGMSEKAIERLWDFDWKRFCAQRVYSSHTQSFPSDYIYSDDPSEHSTLLRKFPCLTTEISERDFSGRYAWVDTVENPQLAAALKKISEKDLELLTFLVMEGHSQMELAEKWDCSQNAISKQFCRLKKSFLKIFE